MMNDVLAEQCTQVAVNPAARPAASLFVSSTLLTWSTETPERFARNFQIDDTVYRRLDPEYYAWLRSRMVVAKKAAAARQIDAAAFEELRGRFNAVHEWAVGYFGEDRLLDAVHTLRADYSPPVPEDDHPRVSLPQVRRSDHVSSEATALVDAIAEKALASGWRRERLYDPGKGTFDPRRGLVCFLKPGDRIGEVTAQSIEIVHPLPSEVRHRFYNPDVEQPWIRKVGADQQKS
jgi:hypothetical protein